MKAKQMRNTQHISQRPIHQNIIRQSVASFMLLFVALAAVLFSHEQSAATNQVIVRRAARLGIRPQISASKNSAARVSSATFANFVLKDQPAASTTTESGVTLSPATINFGYQLVGTTSPQVTERVTNSRTAPLVIKDIDIIGRDRDDFLLAYSFTLPVTIAPGNNVAINLSFTPAVPWSKGTRDAKLKIGGNHGNQFVTLTGIGATCAGPIFAATSGGFCADSDLDGFNDAWEDNDYIDFDNNGKFDAPVDFGFPHQAPYIFSAVTKSGTDVGQLFPTVSNPTAPVEPSTVIVTINSSGGFGAATFRYTVNGGPVSPPARVLPIVDIDGNLRLMFYIGTFVAGNTYTFTAAMGGDMKIADKNISNIFVQYDYMGYDTPGNDCVVNADCVVGGAQPNNVCHAGFCNHNHAPGDPLFRKVVDAFAAHGFRLYIDPVHESVPHAQVITWNQQADGTNGATAACAGYDVEKGNISTGGAVNFHDIKNRPGSPFAVDPFRKNIFHYAMFGHFKTCLTDYPNAPIGNCTQCPVDRSTPSGLPSAGGSGVAELPGNDFILSFAKSLNDPLGSVPTNPFFEGGVFMHELGHNLGLHHAGDVSIPESAPNYLSVMNPKYVFSGIQHAATPGSAVSVESLRELDYSEHSLNTLSECQLDEQAGVSPLPFGFTGIVRFSNAAGGNGAGPESGPIDWTGDGLIDPFLVAVDLNLRNDTCETMVGYRDWDHTAGPSGAGGGDCFSSSDCRINLIRLQIHDLIDPAVDPHEPCLSGRCQSLWLPFQQTQWGRAD